MSRLSLPVVLTTSALLLTADRAWGQKTDQPWTAPRPSYESRVQACTSPTTVGNIALDDWICPVSGTITRVQWWGTVSTSTQLSRRYFVGIWNHSATACRPNARIYSACVTPTSTQVGTDCQNRRVYRFTATLPVGAGGFSQSAGTHYWLQISEIESESVSTGIDFRWSAHRPVSPAPLCQAVQINAAGGVTQPLLDLCETPPGANDLAFRLYGPSTSISGTLPQAIGSDVFLAEVTSPTGLLMELLVLHTDSNGAFFIEPQSPMGNYVLRIRGRGIIPLQMNVVLQNNMDTPVSFFDVFFGDLNGDGVGDGNDIPLMVRGLLLGP